MEIILIPLKDFFLNPKQLYDSYQEYKQNFHNYINNIKKNSPFDIYTIINASLIKNPYTSEFPLRYFQRNTPIFNKTSIFIKSLFKFYAKNIYLYISYITATILYKIFYKKYRKNKLKIIIDTFGLIDKTNETGSFQENYLVGIYEIFEKFNTQYAILLRLYKVGQNPFKLINFFKIINKDKREFIFEYEFLTINNFIELFGLIIKYPFKTLRLLQTEKSIEDKIFNYSLIIDLKNVNFDSLTRYIFGKNLSNIESINKIYSWNEFQVVERSFNYGIRSNSQTIKLIGLQFYLNYETYFNAYIDDLDFDMQSSPHEILVNGKYYLQKREKVRYGVGVSLRYKNIFTFQGIQEENNILLLGSYIEVDTKYMLKSIENFKNIIFKNHPAVDIKKFGDLPNNITISNDNIYKLFETAKLVIGTASGTSVEAVACGVSVIIIASADNLTANPLVEYGQGKIWDIAYDMNEIEEIYRKLIDYRAKNKGEIMDIANWYKDNFFCEPTDENLVKTFGFKQ
jgi:hypothetical protein